MKESMSIKRRKEVAAMDAFESKRSQGDVHSTKVEATINGCVIRGYILDGGIAVNVMASWFMDDIGQTPRRNSSIRLNVVDQRSVRSLGQVSNVPMTINGITVNLDFQVLNIIEGNGGYSIILGRPWLRKVKTMNYWKNRQMKIGPKLNRIHIEVIPQRMGDSTESPKDSLDYFSDMSWTLKNSSTSFKSLDKELEAEVFSLESIP
jgi:hypothetical protein